MKYCADKVLDKYVDSLVHVDGWSVVRGAKHFIAVAPSGRKLPIPHAAGGPKNFVMWRAQARRLALVH